MGGLFRRPLLTACVLLAVGLLCVGGLYWQLLHWADTPFPAAASAGGAGAHFTLDPGDSLSSLAQQLQDQGLLDERRRLLVLARMLALDTKLQAGEYRFEAGLTPRALLLKLNRGDVVTYSFRIIEGVTVAQLLAQLAAEPRLQHLLQATDVQALHSELGLQSAFAEGMFFPDTYQYRSGDSDKVLLLRAHQAMLEQLQQAWKTRAEDLVIRSPEEAMILASIIEKETGLASDRGLISQVFHKRLRERMKLQTDPTVIYALGDSFDGNLTRAHLQLSSPFNTYRVRGLPPTPIALPSAASLRAALHPAPGEFLYFVARGDGASQFSLTLAEHNRAVRKYQLGQAQ